MTSQIFKVVFEDHLILVIEKLQPFLSQKSDAGSQEGLYEFVARTLGFELFPVHRLDREVLGLMIFAKTPGAAENLSMQFRDRKVSKVYEAIVKGVVKTDHARLEHYLLKNEKTNHVTVYPRETPGAKRAELSYRVIERYDDSTKLLIDLKTGRSHQIRAQMAKVGHPILGDHRYGSKTESIPSTSISLRAVQLGIDHPESHQRMQWSLI